MILVWIFLILEALTSAVCNRILSLKTQEVTSEAYDTRLY